MQNQCIILILRAPISSLGWESQRPRLTVFLAILLAPCASVGRWWRVVDAASDLLGTELPTVALGDPAVAVLKGNAGRAKVDGESVWIQGVKPADFEGWKEAK